MSDDRSFMDKVLGRDEPGRDEPGRDEPGRNEPGRVDTRERPADTPAPRAHHDGPTADDVRDQHGYDRPVDGTVDQRQGQRQDQRQDQGRDQGPDQRMRPADPPVDVSRDVRRDDRRDDEPADLRDGPRTDHTDPRDPDGPVDGHLDQRQSTGGSGTQGFRDGHQTAEGLPTTDTRRHAAAHDPHQPDDLQPDGHRSDDHRSNGRPDAEWSEPGTDRRATTGAGPATNGERGASLVASERAEEYRRRWESLKAGFVDEPRGAVKEADELVGRVLDDVAELFARQRAELESDLRNEQASTEDLRQALGRYRSFFDRLLTV